MKLKFTKMQGIGNDYIYVNCMQTPVPSPEQLAIRLSDRHFGIGSDGLILILPSSVADARMQMFNADGSEGKMCGNGIRCVGKFLYDNGLVSKNPIRVETLAGIKILTLSLENGQVAAVRVDMGKAVLTPAEIPVKTDLPLFVNQPVEVEGKTYGLTCVSMGNPHAVLFCEKIDRLNLEQIGPSFEHHPLFPDRINTEFVRWVDRSHIDMRVWERGSGETMACGTGACASVVACVLNGKCDYDSPVTVSLRGGKLDIVYQKDGSVLMTGPATKVFDGEVEI